jgi:hypothetical protein
MGFGYIPEDKERVGEEVTIVDKVTEIICSCFETTKEETILLQILKALLAAVTNCKVSGQSLRTIIKICFNIHLITKNIDNQRTAMASLTQMLNLIFRRIEKKKTGMDELVTSYVKDIVENTLKEITKTSTPNMSDQSHKDAFFIFRALCRLSMKEVE